MTARLRQAGAVFVGKTNLHEFAFGTTSEDSGFGPARHPHDPSRSPGGSSGGSAISVATGMALATVGTDTGGSIRIPAAACGIVGLKPEWGEIPAGGVVPLSRQLDHVGPMTRSVADAWLLYDVMRGAAHEGVPRGGSIRGLRIGVPRGYLFDRARRGCREPACSRPSSGSRLAGAHIVGRRRFRTSPTPSTSICALVLADAAEISRATLDTQPDDYTPNVRLPARDGALRDGRGLRPGAAAAGTAGARRRSTRSPAWTCSAAPALAIPAPPIGADTVPVKGGPDSVRAAMLRYTQLFNLSRVTPPCRSRAARRATGGRSACSWSATGRAPHVCCTTRSPRKARSRRA